MIASLFKFRTKQKILQRLLITIALLGALLPARMLNAHEVSPSVSNLVIDGNQVSVDISLNIEAFVARINLEALTNTDDSDATIDYDEFRAMTPEKLELAFREFWLDMTDRFSINAPDPLALALNEITIPETGNVDLPRESRIDVTATLPPGSPGVTVSWPAEYGMLVIRQQGVDNPFTGLIANGGVSELITAGGTTENTTWQTFVAYIPVGFDHIIPKGLDHILFVLGLFFLTTRLTPLLWQISVFTLAHTVTLALGSLGWVSIPATIVEPLIAASIVYVAIENLLTNSLRPSRTLIVFLFGLLHGLGFASVLGEFGLPANSFVPALVGFNIGVELGQLAVVAITFFAIALWCRNHPDYRKWITIPASLIISLIGTWWFIERAFLA